MKINIIGGGIIGLFSAYYLQEEGHEVHVFDKGDMLDGCSYGNAGMITPSHFVPLAAPGVVAQGIRWMFNPSSPFYIKPRFNLELVQWLWQFYRSCNKGQAEAAMPVLLDFNLEGRKLYNDFLERTALDFNLENQGILMLYKTTKKEKEEHETADKAATLGIETQRLDAQEVKAFETGTSVDALGGVFYPCDSHLYPNLLMERLLSLLEKKGVQMHAYHPVQGFEVKGKKVTAIISNHEKFSADTTVIATGSWSPFLLKKLGVKLLLQDGKGYSFTLSHPVERPRYATILSEAKVAVTPMGNDLRFGGTLELGGLSPSINHSRVKGIVNAISQYYPNIKVIMPAEQDLWYGFRPCSPDGMPYIGRVKGIDNLVLATGHAMMGLSLGPSTGTMISDLIANRNVRTDYLKLFDPQRF